MDNGVVVTKFGHWIGGITYQMQAGVEFNHAQFKDMVNSMFDDRNHGQEKEVCFFHSDFCASREQSQACLSYAEMEQNVRSNHLGSASWKNERFGKTFASERADEPRSGILHITTTYVQHLQYLPYGERFVAQRTSDYSERFTFTGKEKDEETGYGYFGARYMDHELMAMWLSVDPMMDKYPNISPYAYCAWSPIIAKDPNGMDSVRTPNGMANAGEGYKTTPDGMYLYGDGLQTKKWNPNLEIGGVIGDECRGGYEDYFGPPIEFNCANSSDNISIELNNGTSTVSCPIPVSVSVSFGALFSEIAATIGDALTTAVSSLLIIPACLLFSGDSSPNQNAVRGGTIPISGNRQKRDMRKAIKEEYKTSEGLRVKKK